MSKDINKDQIIGIAIAVVGALAAFVSGRTFTFREKLAENERLKNMPDSYWEAEKRRRRPRRSSSSRRPLRQSTGQPWLRRSRLRSAARPNARTPSFRRRRSRRRPRKSDVLQSATRYSNGGSDERREEFRTLSMEMRY